MRSDSAILLLILYYSGHAVAQVLNSRDIEVEKVDGDASLPDPADYEPIVNFQSLNIDFTSDEHDQHDDFSGAASPLNLDSREPDQDVSGIIEILGANLNDEQGKLDLGLESSTQSSGLFDKVSKDPTVIGGGRGSPLHGPGFFEERNKNPYVISQSTLGVESQSDNQNTISSDISPVKPGNVIKITHGDLRHASTSEELPQPSATSTTEWIKEIISPPISTSDFSSSIPTSVTLQSSTANVSEEEPVATAVQSAVIDPPSSLAKKSPTPSMKQLNLSTITNLKTFEGLSIPNLEVDGQQNEPLPVIGINTSNTDLYGIEQRVKDAIDQYLKENLGGSPFFSKAESSSTTILGVRTADQLLNAPSTSFSTVFTTTLEPKVETIIRTVSEITAPSSIVSPEEPAPSPFTVAPPIPEQSPSSLEGDETAPDASDKVDESFWEMIYKEFRENPETFDANKLKDLLELITGSEKLKGLETLSELESLDTLDISLQTEEFAEELGPLESSPGDRERQSFLELIKQIPKNILDLVEERHGEEQNSPTDSQKQSNTKKKKNSKSKTIDDALAKKAAKKDQALDRAIKDHTSLEKIAKNQKAHDTVKPAEKGSDGEAKDESGYNQLNKGKLVFGFDKKPKKKTSRKKKAKGNASLEELQTTDGVEYYEPEKYLFNKSSVQDSDDENQDEKEKAIEDVEIEDSDSLDLSNPTAEKGTLKSTNSTKSPFNQVLDLLDGKEKDEKSKKVHNDPYNIPKVPIDKLREIEENQSDTTNRPTRTSTKVNKSYGSPTKFISHSEEVKPKSSLNKFMKNPSLLFNNKNAVEDSDFDFTRSDATSNSLLSWSIMGAAVLLATSVLLI